MSASTPDSELTRAAWKILASVLAVVGAVGFLLFQSTKEDAQYYKHVDEVMASLEGLRGKRLQVHGHVVDGSIEQARGTLEYRFQIETRVPRRPAMIEASYTGIVPDTFKSGAEVVATGKLTVDNRLVVAPDGIMAKCPSKYEAKTVDPAARAQAAPPVAGR